MGWMGGSLQCEGKAVSGWVRELWRLENEDNGFKQKWFSTTVQKKVGKGMRTAFWKDLWVEDGLLCEKCPRLFSLNLDKQGSVADLMWWRDGMRGFKWRWRRNLFQ